MTTTPRPGCTGGEADAATPPCVRCAAAGTCCCRSDPALAHLIFPLSPAERQRLAAHRGKAVFGFRPAQAGTALSGLCPERAGKAREQSGGPAADAPAACETPWAARPNSPELLRAVRSLFPRDKTRIDELFPADGEHWSLRLRPDGACVFLDGGTGCRLPRAARPGYCLLFPVWMVNGTLTLFVSQDCLLVRTTDSPARCAGLMGTDRAALSLIYARLRREWGLDAAR
ncbi:MAG: hypothetical protein LBP38_07645 [Desulfovibrio sp.]|jgi:Fe-S-cluster containining protein|nr:hypothetical protein [Desulfovibrio sp.]